MSSILNSDLFKQIIDFSSKPEVKKNVGDVLNYITTFMKERSERKKKKEQEEKARKRKRLVYNPYLSPDDPDYIPPPPPEPTEPPRKRRKKELWDIPGISEKDKAEIMRIEAATEAVKRETEEKIRMLIPSYKKLKEKEKEKPKPLRKEKPVVRPRVKDDVIPPPPPPPLPEEDDFIPPPPPPPPEEDDFIPPPPPPVEDDDSIPPPPPDEPAPEPPRYQDISVPVPPAPIAPAPPPPSQPSQRQLSWLEQIREGVPLRPTPQGRPPIQRPRPVNQEPDLMQLIKERMKQRRPSITGNEQMSGYGRRKGRAVRGSGKLSIPPTLLARALGKKK